MRLPLAAAFALALAVQPALHAQSRASEAVRADYAAKLRTLKIEIGQRHLELGIECRDKGLTTQSADQILLSVEESEKLNPGANTVLGMLRQYDEHFWKKRAPKPTPARLDAYARDAAKIEAKNLAERLELFVWAHKRGLQDEVFGDVLALLRRRDEPLEFDGEGLLAIGAKKLPADLSARIKAESIVVNGRTYVRDEFVAHVPTVAQLFESVDDALRVRSKSSIEQATGLHELGVALMAQLERDVGARPRKRLTVVVVPDRASYEAFLDASGLGAHKVVKGVADSASLTAVITSEDLDQVQLDGIFLHELTHLFQFGVSRTVMPNWYSEGFADTYGGQGTFHWDAGKLEVGGLLDVSRLATLRSGALPFPIETMLSADALSIWSSGLERGLAFYAQSWAWLRFLRTGAGAEVAADLERWETMCRGSALGAEIGKPRASGAGAAEAAFRKLFGAKLAQLETQFVAWLATQ